MTGRPRPGNSVPRAPATGAVAAGGPGPIGPGPPFVRDPCSSVAVVAVRSCVVHGPLTAGPSSVRDARTSVPFSGSSPDSAFRRSPGRRPGRRSECRGTRWRCESGGSPLFHPGSLRIFWELFSVTYTPRISATVSCAEYGVRSRTGAPRHSAASPSGTALGVVRTAGLLPGPPTPVRVSCTPHMSTTTGVDPPATPRGRVPGPTGRAPGSGVPRPGRPAGRRPRCRAPRRSGRRWPPPGRRWPRPRCR